MSLGFRAGNLGTPSPGLRPRALTEAALVEAADEDLTLGEDRLVLVADCFFFSGESESPKLSLSSTSGEAATSSTLPTIEATVGKTMAMDGTMLRYHV